MPVFHLPKLLENNINNILECSTVTSWNIRGEESACSITIRFSVQDTPDHPILDTSNITYRKAPPSYTARSKQRARDYNNSKTEEQQIDDSFKDISTTPMNATECALNQPSQASISPVPQQVDGLADTPTTACHTSEEGGNIECDNTNSEQLPCKQYDSSTNKIDLDNFIITKDLIKHKISMKCAKCHLAVNPLTPVQCCLSCNVFLCKPCLIKGITWCGCDNDVFTNLRPLAEFIEAG